jgi:uncharacterized membrane protein
MESLAGFKEVAPYLTHPLVLVGFVLFLVFGIHRMLLRAKIIPPLKPREGSKVVQIVLRYGLWIALVAMILGFALTFYKTQLEHNPAFPTRRSG